MLKKHVTLLVISFTMLFLNILTINADSQNPKMSFQVSTTKLNNQIADVDYFDLNMKNQKNVELPIQITNPSNQDVTVSIDIIDGTTTSLGEIQYTKENSYQKSRGNRLSDFVKEKHQLVTIPKNKTISKKIPVKVSSNISGVVLGGIKVSQVNSDSSSEKNEESGQMTVQNTYAYVLGVQLHFKDLSKNTFNWSLGDINLKKIHTESKLVIDINNDNQKVVRKASSKIIISKLDSNKKKIISEEFTKLDFAPMSTLSQQINPENITAGTYEAQVTIEHDKYKRVLTKKFTVSAKDEKSIIINSEKPTLKPTFSKLSLIIMAIVLLVAGALGYKYLRVTKGK